MAKKKLFLILFAVCASFSALASNLTHISAPTLAGSVTDGELSVEVARTEAPRATTDVPNVAPNNAAIVNNTEIQPAAVSTESAPSEVAVSDPAAPFVSEQTSASSVALPFAEPPLPNVYGDLDPHQSVSTKVEIGDTFFLSEWTELPKADLAGAALFHDIVKRPETAFGPAKRSIFSPLARVGTGEPMFKDRPSVPANIQHFASSPRLRTQAFDVREPVGILASASRTFLERSIPVADRVAATFSDHQRVNIALLDGDLTIDRDIFNAQLSSIDRVVNTTGEHLKYNALTDPKWTTINHLADGKLAMFEPIFYRSVSSHFSMTRPDGFSGLDEHNFRTVTGGTLVGLGKEVRDFRQSQAVSDHLQDARAENSAGIKTLPSGDLSVASFVAPVVNDVLPSNTVNTNNTVAAFGSHNVFGRANNSFDRPHDGSASIAKIFRPLGQRSDEIISANRDFLGQLWVQQRNIASLTAPPISNLVAETPGRVNTPDLSAAAAGPVRQLPVLIENKVAFSRAMLAPIPLRPTETSEFVAQTVAMKGGPSIDVVNSDLLARKNLPVANSSLPVLISSKAEFSTDVLKPMKTNANSLVPITIPASSKQNAAPQQAPGYCDPNFVGEPIRFSQTVELRLEDLLSQLHARFGVNFIMGPNIGKLPLNVKAGSIPWNVLLRSQLFISGVRARCIDQNTIELIENSVLPNLQDSDGVNTKFVKLKFLQRTGGGTVDLANRSQGGQNGGQGGCGGGGVGGGGGGGGGQIAGGGGGGGGGGGQSGQTAASQGSSRFDQLVQEIEKILGLRSMTGGGSGGGEGSEERRTDRFVTQIPGRNILAIRATPDEHDLIAQIIERADRPPFQVVIKGLVYSANQDRLRDIGVQTTITGGNASGSKTVGIFGDTLGVGTLFDFSAIIGTFDFNVQATAFQQNGVISVKSRPFATVLDGLCTTLSVGTKLPIVIDSTLGGQGGITILNADNLLAVTPYVVDDENGNPIAVTLDLNLQANVIDSSITARGVPAVNSKNIQTQLLLGPNKTAILGGFSIDQDSKTVTKVPGLGDIPIIGELFKRRIQDQRLSRLYFAISAEVIPYGKAIEPVVVPGATTDPLTISEEMKKRAEAAEPKAADPNQPYVPKKKKDN